jgi:hypothetical protein
MLKRFLVLLFPITAFTQNYSILFIPDSLQKNANSVVRINERKLQIKNPGKATIKHKWAITIFNEAAKDNAQYSNYYDKLHDLSDIKGTLYDAMGKEIRSIRKRDIQDQSSDDGFSLLTDARFKAFTLSYQTYPYTVEFEDEEEYIGLYSFPKWYAIDESFQSVQKASYSVQAPKDYMVRFKHVNIGNPEISEDNNTKTYTWAVNNLKAIEYEIFQPNFHELVPVVFTGATEFEYGGYKGNMKSWKDYGLFLHEIAKGKDELPENIKQEAIRLTESLTSKKEKVKAIYNFLQQNTRYISVQLGIGGLQPFDAKYVAQKKYGDCKALSNYMQALLKAIDIKSHLVSVAAGKEYTNALVEDFPNHYSNHKICCVPLDKDTIWLECTSQTESAGFMGSFTGDRKALLIAEDGGYIVSTPRYSPMDNKQQRKIIATINEEGTLTANFKTLFSGIQQETAHNILHNYSQKQRTDYLNSYINLPNYVVEKNDYKETKGSIPTIEETLNITSQNYATVSGKRMFITPNIIEKQSLKLPTEKPRMYDIQYNHNFVDIDSIEITIPKGYTLEAMAKDVTINNKFGEYSIKFSFEGNAIKVTRMYKRLAERFPKTDYQEMVKFYDDTFKADRSRMVFVKNE